MEGPYAVKKLSEEDINCLKKIYSGRGIDYLKVGAKGYFLNADFVNYAAEIYNMQLRPTDVFVASYPRSGTTWTQELVWLLINELNFGNAKSTALITRFAFLEIYMISNLVREVNPEVKLEPPVPEILPKMSDPRFIKTHLPMSLLPEKILDTAKMVYVARDPRDVVVSCYHFYHSLVFEKFNCDLKGYFEVFIKDLAYWSPYWDHLEEAWAIRHHPNMLFLFYEDLKKDLKSCVNRVAKFLNKEYSDEQLDKLCDHLRFDNFQKNPSFHLGKDLIEDERCFIRKGKSGGWREEFDSEMTARACAWMRDNMRTRNLDLPWSLE